MDFITSVFMLPLEVETAPAAQSYIGALLDLEFLRCELLPPFHREVSAFFPSASWLYCRHFPLVKRQNAHKTVFPRGPAEIPEFILFNSRPYKLVKAQGLNLSFTWCAVVLQVQFSDILQRDVSINFCSKYSQEYYQLFIKLPFVLYLAGVHTQPWISNSLFIWGIIGICWRQFLSAREVTPGYFYFIKAECRIRCVCRWGKMN